MNRSWQRHRQVLLACLLHDLVGAQASGGQQHDPRSPHVFLRAVAIRNDRFKASTIGGFHIDGDPGACPVDLHNREHTGIRIRILPSDFIHSHVRRFQVQASKFVACEQALLSGSSGQGRRHGR
jgi:hypothetical protein